MKTQIKLVARKDYTTEVSADGRFAYRTGLHKKTEFENLTALIRALQMEDVIEVITEEK